MLQKVNIVLIRFDAYSMGVEFVKERGGFFQEAISTLCDEVLV